MIAQSKELKLFLGLSDDEEPKIGENSSENVILFLSRKTLKYFATFLDSLLGYHYFRNNYEKHHHLSIT